jgi:hypothetical protein
MSLKLLDRDTFRYEQDTVIELPGRPEPFHHRDSNTLRRVKA